MYIVSNFYLLPCHRQVGKIQLHNSKNQAFGSSKDKINQNLSTKGSF